MALQSFQLTPPGHHSQCASVVLSDSSPPCHPSHWTQDDPGTAGRTARGHGQRRLESEPQGEPRHHARPVSLQPEVEEACLRITPKCERAQEPDTPG